MLDLPLGITKQNAAVRKPAFAVHIGAAGAESGGLGGLLGAAGSALGLAGGSDDPWAAALVSLAVDLNVAPGVDVAVLQIANELRAPQVAVGDTGSLDLGYADGETVTVFTGQVEAVRHSLAGTTRVTLVNGGATLARRRLNKSYQQQAAGAIVKDLLGEASVTPGKVEDGIDYPFYAVDDSVTLYQHIARLARSSGHLATMTPENKLAFAPFVADAVVQTFHYGEDLILAQVGDTPAPAGILITGEGAAGSQGADAWAWLVKDATLVQKTARDAGGATQLVDAALRSGGALEKAAAAYLDRQAQKVGYMVAPGAPAVTAGAAIEIAGAPQAALNGLYQACRVRHTYDKGRGFVTRIEIAQVSAGGAAGAGLLGALGGLL